MHPHPAKTRIPLHPDPPRAHPRSKHPTKKQWETLLLPPHGGGAIFAAEPGDAPAKEGREPIPVLYGVGMFHQLHCLVALRGILFPETSQRRGNSTAESFRGNREGDRLLWAHCFDYLAQTVLCGADDTLERPGTIEIDGRVIHHINGDGGIHRCRDARALWKYAEQSYYEPVDMNQWPEGMGAREIFKGWFDDLPDEVPELYTPAMQRPA